MCEGASLDILKLCGGCYESPRDDNFKILGPVVAYAGKYKTATDEEKQWVGPDYFNFAMAEQDPGIRNHFAEISVEGVRKKFVYPPTVVIGMPMGGILLAGDIGRLLHCRTIFAEKKIIALADPEKGLKEVSELIIERHKIDSYDRVAIVEDVCNNFSTTEKAVELISSTGAEFLCILCAINRSEVEEWRGHPVISAIFRPSEQYHQDDPAVANLIAEGKIAWKPKQQWEMLKAAM
jgi:adenine/guanine phosphoribosyltransferase-like PRPP-binding protein